MLNEREGEKLHSEHLPVLKGEPGFLSLGPFSEPSLPVFSPLWTEAEPPRPSFPSTGNAGSMVVRA